MTMITDTSALSMTEILDYCDKGLLDIEGADLIADAFREGYNEGFEGGTENERRCMEDE